MKYFYELRMLLTYFVLLVPSFLPAGGHLPVSSSGIPYKWDNTAALGFPPGVIGFASIEVIDPQNILIIESFQLYNGDFIDGDPNDAGELTQAQMQAVIKKWTPKTGQCFK